jgi:membrane protein DedA with SNARE-associated domain
LSATEINAVPSIDQVFQWLTALPAIALYAAAFWLAFIENVFPPFPSDLFIGLCAFVAARGDALLTITFVCVLAGNVSGAAFTYALGRKYGAAELRARLEARGWIQGEQRLETMYAKYGMIGLFIGRMIPGIRGIVPMLAGAMRIKASRVLAIVTVAAALWYGLLTGLAYSVGDNWERYSARISALGRWGTIAGLSLMAVAIGIGIWMWRRKHRSR